MLGLGLSYISFKVRMRMELRVAKPHLEPRSDMFTDYTFKWPLSAHFFLGRALLKGARRTIERPQAEEVQVERSLAIRTQDTIYCCGHFAQSPESGCIHGSLCPEHSVSTTGCRHQGRGGQRE